MENDVVFKGTAKKNIGSNNIFEIEELYKSTDSAFIDQKQINVSSSGFNEIKFPVNSEWIIYGKIEKSGNHKIIRVSNCGKSKLTTRQYLEYADKHKDKLEDLVFIGTVKNSTHQRIWKTNKYLVQSAISFDVRKIINNKTEQRISIESKEILINVTACGQAYLVGNKYIISAKEIFKGYKKTDGTYGRKREFHMDCIPNHSFSYSEEEDLRKFSSLPRRSTEGSQ